MTIASFLYGKQVSTIGLTLAFGIWFGWFFIIGGEWFLAWQIQWGTGKSSASRLLTTVGTTLVFINLPEDH